MHHEGPSLGKDLMTSSGKCSQKRTSSCQLLQDLPQVQNLFVQGHALPGTDCIRWLNTSWPFILGLSSHRQLFWDNCEGQYSLQSSPLDWAMLQFDFSLCQLCFVPFLSQVLIPNKHLSPLTLSASGEPTLIQLAYCIACPACVKFYNELETSGHSRMYNLCSPFQPWPQLASRQPALNLFQEQRCQWQQSISDSCWQHHMKITGARKPPTEISATKCTKQCLWGITICVTSFTSNH